MNYNKKFKITAIVKGRVQGVCYRAFAKEKALELGLKGTVKNLPDGSVEVKAEGEKKVLEQFISFLRVGPMMASVSDVMITWVEADIGYKLFQIVY